MNPSLSQILAPLAGPDERRRRILDGAMGCFLAYGYQRTTMDDIARAAEISRPALYLLFRNKTDIYRALAQAFTEHVLDHAQTELARPGDLGARLTRALTCVFDLVGTVEDSPHGADMLDMKSSLAADIVGEARARMTAFVEAAIKAHGRGPLPPRDYAEMLLDAVDGMKLRMLAPAEQERLKQSYVSVIVTACGAAAS